MPYSSGEYAPGDRVELLHTDDEYTKLRRGCLGTVVAVGDRGLDISWDDGSDLSMLFDAGDQVRLANRTLDSGWVIEPHGFGMFRYYTLRTPEGEPVTDREANPWRFSSPDDAEAFVTTATDPAGV